jgi:large subunit ribosomal protein L15
MKLNNLKPKKGSKRKKKIVGRGNGSNMGTYCGRGMNGQNSRSGGGTRPGFEGGQMPIHRRLPKRGFKNYLFRKDFAIINIGDLDKFDSDTIEGYFSAKKMDKLKLLGNGKVEKSFKLKVNAASKTAIEKIEKAGGSVEVLD